jgi:hypothetical protein
MNAQWQPYPLQVHAAVYLGVPAERVIGPDPEVARRGDACASAERRTVHGGDRDLVHFEDGADHLGTDANLPALTEARALQVFCGAAVGEIDPCAEVLALAGKNHDPRLHVVVKRIRGVGDLAHQGPAQRVQLVGSIERHDRDVTVLGNFEMLVIQSGILPRPHPTLSGRG